MEDPMDVTSAQDTIYLCNFRVSVDGDWLCLREVDDVEVEVAKQKKELKEPFPQLRTPSPVDTHLLMPRDPVIIERRNLVNISKLIVKELLDTSPKYGRMLDSDHMTLQHFFIVLEHVLRHGIRPKKGLLGPKKELWDILQLVEKFSAEAHDVTDSIRNLPTVKTSMGRARAWLRVSLMQKKLADYLKILIDRKDEILCDYFEPDALLRSEEALVIVGLLVGLNVIDCNLCVKEEDLDCELGVIDFSLYLKSNHIINNGSTGSVESTEYDNMTAVLDQKNYIEELNRHLNATVGNLQSKVEDLMTNNALMKEDLDIAKEHITSLMQENAFLKAQKSRIYCLEHESAACNSLKKKIENVDDDELSDLSRINEELLNEKKLKEDIQKELNIQICIKAEMEVAMKLMEKDIHEKQDTIISLRKQLEDIKQINLEMYRKLQESNAELSHNKEYIKKLEGKTATMDDEMRKQDEKHKNLEKDRMNAMESFVKEKEQTVLNVEKLATVMGELKIETEWRESLEKLLIEEKDRVLNLQQETAQLKTLASKYVTLQEEHNRLEEQCREQEKTLEELGEQIRKSKLEVSDLKEEAFIKKSKCENQWTDDKEVTHCKLCAKEFNMTRRKHHCRNCGEIFCNMCSDNTMSLPSSAKPVRVCDDCYQLLLERYTVI